MISEDLAKIFAHLKKDDIAFFQSNWSLVSNDIENNFLSLCIEEKAFKVFNFALTKGLTNIRSIIVANSIRQNNQMVLDLINSNNLFEYQGKQGMDLFSISVNNNDIKVIEYLKEQVNVSSDILQFAIKSQNVDLIKDFLDKKYQWTYIYPEDNPIVFIFENYKDKKTAISCILEHSTQRDKLKEEALLYYEDTPAYIELQKYL